MSIKWTRVLALVGAAVVAVSGAGGVRAEDKESTAVGSAEVTGLFPSINERTECDNTCADIYEAKCTQASSWMDVTINDLFGDDGFYFSVVGLTPTSVYGKGDTYFTAGGDGGYTLALHRPGAQGTMKAMVTVFSYQHNPGFSYADYKITIGCWSVTSTSTAPRNASLIKKQDE